MNHYVLSIDQGTTGSTALIVRLNSNDQQQVELVSKTNIEFPQHFPKPGWVEHDLDELWSSVRGACLSAIDKAQKSDSNFDVSKIESIGITNQRETTCAFSKKDGTPLAKAIVWQCKRTSPICDALKAKDLSGFVLERTGLVLDPYFSASKMQWLLDNVSAVQLANDNQELHFGTIDTFLLYRLTQCRSFKAEVSNASRTMLFNLKTCQWDEELIQLFPGLKSSMLGEIAESSSQFGETKGLDFLPDGIPITGILGDQQAALFGQGATHKNEAKCTFGTGSFMLMNTGSRPEYSKNGLLTTVAWKAQGRIIYALEGGSFTSGACIQYLRDSLGILKNAKESESIAENTSAMPDVVFVPALAGLGAPHWNARARGAFLGLTRGSDSSVLIRAVLEAMAMQTLDLTATMEESSKEGNSLVQLNVDGGAAANNVFLQILSNVLNVRVRRADVLETTGLGAAFMSMLGAGLLSDIDSVRGCLKEDRMFHPSENFVKQERPSWIKTWKKALAACQIFSEVPFDN